MKHWHYLSGPSLALAMTFISVFTLGFFVIGLTVFPSVCLALGITVGTGLICLIIFYMEGGIFCHHTGSMRRFNR